MRFMEKIKIKNSLGENLAGILHKSKKSSRLVIVCHGRVCTKEEHFYPELCKELSRNGFNAFRFYFSGNGESDGKFEDSTITKDIEDIKSVVDFFINEKYEIFCLIGHSQGAVVVILHQAKYNSAKCIVDIAAYADQKDATINKFLEKQIKELDQKGFLQLNAWGKSFNLYKKYFYDRAGYGDIKEEIRKIKVPVLIVHGKEDKDVPIKNSENMIFALSKKGKFIPIDGADHFFANKEYRSILISSIINWFKSL